MQRRCALHQFDNLHSLASNCEFTLIGCCALQKIPVPLNGDESAVRKYADEVEALKRKVRSLSQLLHLHSYALCCALSPDLRF